MAAAKLRVRGGKWTRWIFYQKKGVEKEARRGAAPRKHPTDFGSSGWHWGVEGEAGSGDEAVEGVGPVLE
ncbi:hypothetical protein ACPCTO_35300, partial [Streptomyces olivoreticuli]